MREMKDSGVEWIGKIPKDWEIVPIKANVSIMNGSDPVLEGDVPVWGSGSEPFKTCGEYKQGPVVLLGRKGTLDCPQYVTGRYWNVDTAFDARCRTNDLNLRFFYYVARSIDVNPFSTNTAKPSMTQTDWGNIKMPLPSLTEQRRIVSYLDEKCAEIDGNIASRRGIIEKLGEYKKALIARTVTKGLDPDVEMRDSGVEGVGRIPVSWRIVPLRSLYSFSKGLSITKADLTNEGVPVVSYGQIHAKYNRYASLDDSLIRFVPETIAKNSVSSKAEKGCFIFADTSEDLEGCGNSVFVDRDYVYGGYHTIVLKPKGHRSGKFLAYLFQTDAWRQQIRRELVDVKVFSINQNRLKQTYVIQPPIEEQRRIVSYLDEKCAQVDELVARQAEIIGRLEEYRKSLIAYAVTGRVDCREGRR